MARGDGIHRTSARNVNLAKVCSMEPEKKNRDKPRSPSLRQWLYK